MISLRVGSKDELDRARRLRYYRLDEVPSSIEESNSLMYNEREFAKHCKSSGWPIIMARYISEKSFHRDRKLVGFWSVMISLPDSLRDVSFSVRQSLGRLFTEVCTKQVMDQSPRLHAVDEMTVNGVGLLDNQADIFAFKSFDKIMEYVENPDTVAVAPYP